MRVEIYDDSQKQLWDEFVNTSKNGTFLFYRDYMDYHRDRFIDHSLLVWDAKDRLVALLPANRQGNEIISHGGLTYGGFVTNENMKMPLMLAVFDNLLTHVQSQGVERFVYKSIPAIYHRIPAEEDRYALFIAQARFLRRGVLAVLSSQCRPSFQERRTRGLRKAHRHGLEPRESKDYSAFWAILSQVLLQIHKTRPVHSLEEIELLHMHFPQNIRLFGSFESNCMLAGVVVYESENVAHAQYIAASNEGRNLGALDLLFDYLINDVYKHKPFFDFGTSDDYDGQSLNKGLMDQKEGFGARVVVHDHFEILLNAWTPGQILSVLT